MTDKILRKTLLLSLMVLFTMGNLLAWKSPGHETLDITVLLWGAVAFGNVAGLQVYVVQQAEHFTPRAVDVASGLNIAAFNLGIAGGAWGGGLIVEHLGLVHTGWIGALVVQGAFGLTALSGRMDRLNSPPVRTGGEKSMHAVGH